MLDLIYSTLSTKALATVEVESENFSKLVNALEAALVHMGSISIPFWMDIYKNDTLFNNTLFVLAHYELVEIEINGHYASMSIHSRLLGDDFIEFRKEAKINLYSMKLDQKEYPSNITRTPNGLKETGLDRPGFMYAAKNSFRLDTKYLAQYKHLAIEESTKSVNKFLAKYAGKRKIEAYVADEANYGSIAEIVIDNYISNPNAMYNMERALSDQRGRAIMTGLKRLLNLVSSKVGRALVITNSPITLRKTDDLSEIYLFIAELLHSKSCTVKDKADVGRISYERRILPEIADYTQIWLERIYDKLDELKANGKVKWNVPIELDAGMALAQFPAVILNNAQLLKATNLIEDELRDPWEVEGVARLQAKALTPWFYGSNASIKQLLANRKLTATAEEIQLLRKAVKKSHFKVLVDFKDLLIKSSNVTVPEYTVSGWGEEFTVIANKWEVVGTEIQGYNIYNPLTGKEQLVMFNTPVKELNYTRYAYYMATGYTHNRESRVFDKVCTALQENSKWVMSIHDALLVLPRSGARSHYRNIMEELREIGRKDLVSYLVSVGATSDAQERLDALFALPQSDLPLSMNALK